MLLPFGRSLEVSFEIPSFGVMGVLGVGICTNRKLIHDFLLPLDTDVCHICRRPFGGYGGLGGRGLKNGTNQKVGSTFLFDFYAHYRPTLHRLATIHNAAEDRRQTDRSIAMSSSIRGLKTSCDMHAHQGCEKCRSLCPDLIQL